MPKVKALWIQRFGRPGVVSILAGSILGIMSVGPGGAQTQGPVVNAPRAPSPGDARTAKFNEQTITVVYTGKEGSLDCWSVKSSNGNAGRDCRTAERNLVNSEGTVRIPIHFKPHDGMFAFPMFVGSNGNIHILPRMAPKVRVM